MQGVSSHFVDLLAKDERSARSRVLLAVLVALGLAVPAYFLYPWQGVVVHFGAAVMGLLLGHALVGRRVRAYESSLRESWAAWMRLAPGSETVREVHRRVLEKTVHIQPYAQAAVLTILWALELVLLMVALGNETSAVLALPVLGLNGILAGALLSYYVRLRSWTREFRESVSEMVDAGEIGVWGVR